MTLSLLFVLATGYAAAQSDPAVSADANERADPGSETSVEEVIRVIGERPLRDFRIEVELARERVYGLFNSLNSDDKFDITCSSVPRTGTRIPQRVCRPRYAEDATGRAGTEFARALQQFCPSGLSESCLETGSSRAQVFVSEIPVGDQQLDAEVQRLVRENREFRRVVADYQTAVRRYDEARRVVPSGLRVAAFVIDEGRAALPSALDEPRRGIVAPKPIDLATPAVAWNDNDAGKLREGWVKLRFSVFADGATGLVSIVDALPSGVDRTSAIDAVQAWTFEPAQANGVAIDWHNNLAIIVIEREQAIHEAWPDFADAYEDVANLVTAGRYADAKSVSERMQRELAATLDEMAFAQLQLAVIERALGNPHDALNAIRRATEPAVEQLADEELKPALEQRFAIELELGLAADALETYGRRAELGHWPTGDPIARVGAELERTLESPATSLAEQGRLDGNGLWEHSLTWKTFAVGDVDGRTENLELQCNRNQEALPFEEYVQMTIPAGWGECVLLVRGQPGTTFVLYQLKEPAPEA